MKRFIRLLLFGLMMCMLVSCGGQNAREKPNIADSEEEKEDTVFVCNYGLGSGFFTEDYALYHSNQYRLQIFDVASKADIPYCFDAACEHNRTKRSRTGEIIEEGCIAYEFSNASVMLLDDSCYFVQDNGEVYVSDQRGENRRLIGRIPDYILSKDFVCFSENELFVTYFNDYEMTEIKDDKGESSWIAGRVKDESTVGIVMLDLSSGSCKEIFHEEAYNARISLYDVRGKHLYFQYFYLDIPFVSQEDLENNDPSGDIPGGLTAENYWEEMPKHEWMDIYDYDIGTGELNCILSRVRYGETVFCKDFFAVAENGTTALYRYNGECFRRLDFQMERTVRTDSGLVFDDVNEREVYRMIDENTGEVIKQSYIPYSEMLPSIMIGGSCYGLVDGWATGYISTEDFWTGNYDNAIPFQVREEE